MRVPAGIWMLSLGHGASRQGGCLPAVGVLPLLPLGTGRQVTTQERVLAHESQPDCQPAEGEALQMHSVWAPILNTS